MRKLRFREALSCAQVKEDRTGINELELGFPIPYPAYCIPRPLSELSPLPNFQNESSGRSPILCFAQGLDSEHVEFWMQRPRQPAASETSTHQRGAAARGCLTTSFLGQLCARRGVSLAAPKTDFAVSSPHLQSPVGFL